MSEKTAQETGQEAVEQEATPGEGAEDRQPIIPGTTWYTLEDAAKGFHELKGLVDRQGNELGMTRKQLDQYQKMLDKSMSESKGKGKDVEKASGPDYEAEIAKIDDAIAKLDVDDPAYTKELSKLNKQARRLEAERVQTLTEQKLIGQFQQTLNERDTQQTRQAWLDANPDFNTPEMQAMIQDHVAKDRTGLVDPILAYREIQQAQMTEQMKALAAEKAELEKRLALKEGAAQTGKVITKGQSTQAKTNPQTKLKGADLEAAMMQAYENAAGG